MTRDLLEVPRSPQLVDPDTGEINKAWLKQLEELFIIVQNMADALDAASGSASGGTVDTEWNVFVNAVKQD